MKEALKLCVVELREARGEVEEVMHNCAAALAGTVKGDQRGEEYLRQLARIDAAIAAAEAALAQPSNDQLPMITIDRWMLRDALDGNVVAMADAADTLRAMLDSAPAQSAGPFSPCGRGAGTCGISSQTCGRDGCEADVVPADRLPKSQTLDWSAPVVAGTEQLAAVTAERDQLRAEVERLRAQHVPLTDDRVRQLWLSACSDVTYCLTSTAFARLLEREHGITDCPTP